MNFKKFISFGISAMCALSCSTLSYAMILVNSLPKTYKTEEDLKYYDCFKDCKKTESDIAYNLQVGCEEDNKIYNLCKECAYKMILTELEKHENASKFIEETINKDTNTLPCPNCKQNQPLDKIGFCPSCYKALFCTSCYEKTCADISKHCKPFHQCEEKEIIDSNSKPFRFSLSETVYNRDDGFDSFKTFLNKLIDRINRHANPEAWHVLTKRMFANFFLINEAYKK